MDMFMLHQISEEDEMKFPPKFLEDRHINDNLAGNEFVKNPDGIVCTTCDIAHSHPSIELTEPEAEDFLRRLKLCPHHRCARVGNTRRHFLGKYDFLDVYFSNLGTKCNSFQELTKKLGNFDGAQWKLVRESETYKETMTAGPVMDMIMELPEGLLEECKVTFPKLLHKLYRDRTGFVKGRYLVISTENLFRQSRGNIDIFMQTLHQAYALVNSRYCSISRLAMESGFWQVCPEFGGFVWRNTNFRGQFSFLENFLLRRNICLKNFSLSMGPYYLIGGGYYSFLINNDQQIVFWYVPNFWQEGFTNILDSPYSETEAFWFGWYDSGRYGWYSINGIMRWGGPRQHGFPYNGVNYEDSNKDLFLLFYNDTRYRELG